MLEVEHITPIMIMVLNHYRKLNTPVATVIGGGYSKDKKELAERHSIIFETAIKYL